MNLLNPHFTIFGFEIYYYGVIIVTGMILATVLSAVLMRRRNISSDLIYTFFIVCIPTALVCARIYYCVFYYDGWEKITRLLEFRDGGLAVYGGLIGGIGSGIIVCLVKKIPLSRPADCVFPNICLAQAIGRWGNFVNQEAYGNLVENPSWQWFPYAVHIDGKWYQATFFYESSLNFICWVGLFILAWKFVKKPNGIVAFAWLACCGLVRVFVEGLRSDSLYWGPFRISQLLAGIILVVGAGMIAFLLLRNRKKEGCLVGSLRGDPYGITEFIRNDKDDVPDKKINAMRHLYEKEGTQGDTKAAQGQGGKTELPCGQPDENDKPHGGEKDD